MALIAATATPSRSGIVTATQYNTDKNNAINYLNTNVIGVEAIGGLDLAKGGVSSRHNASTSVVSILGSNASVTTTETTVFSFAVNLSAESAAQNFKITWLPTVMKIISPSGAIFCRFRLKRASTALINDRHQLNTQTFQQYVLPAFQDTVAGGASYTYTITAQTDSGTFTIQATGDVASNTAGYTITV